MEQEKRSLGNDYTSFMGNWMAGTLVGHFILKFIIWIAIAIGVGMIFPTLAKLLVLLVVGIFLLSGISHWINKKIDRTY